MPTPALDSWLSTLPQPDSPNHALTVTSPYDGSEIATLTKTRAAETDAALELAYSLFRNRKAWLSKQQRVSILERCADLMGEQFDELVELATKEGGKPLTDCRIEVARAIDSVRLCVEHLRSSEGQVIPMGASSPTRRAFTSHEPIGVVVAVSAFNHPLNLIAHQVAPAVATGCPVVVKPADVTPLSCIRFVELLREAGLPEGWAQVVITDELDVAEALVTDPRNGFFSFIGSARVGWMLRSKLAPGVRCALEHGGAAPVIVCSDTNIDHAVAAITKGGYYHAGQVCVSVQRVFVEDSIKSDFIEALTQSVKGLTVGDPLNASTEVGPLIRTAEVDRCDEWINEALSQGAIRTVGGDPESPFFYPPTVLVEPPADAKVSQQEVFGPLVNVYGFNDIDAALMQANALPVAFQAAVFTNDFDRAMYVYGHLDASAVMLNDHSAFRIDGMPFAGLRQSGLGVGGIPHTMEEMQTEKMLVLNSTQ